MTRTSFFAGLCVLLFSASLLAQVPSLESTKSLPAGVYSATSAASDGYGQHMVTIDNGTVKHYLIGNNGEEIAGYTQNVATGEYPAITSFGGRLRVTMKQGKPDFHLPEPEWWSNMVVLCFVCAKPTRPDL